jgi:hypothetical protein
MPTAVLPWVIQRDRSSSACVWPAMRIWWLTLVSRDSMVVAGAPAGNRGEGVMGHFDSRIPNQKSFQVLFSRSFQRRGDRFNGVHEAVVCPGLKTGADVMNSGRRFWRTSLRQTFLPNSDGYGLRVTGQPRVMRWKFVWLVAEACLRGGRSGSGDNNVYEDGGSGTN